MKLSRQVGTTNQLLNVFIRDATNTSSAGLANVVASSVAFSILRSDMAAISTGTCSTTAVALGTYNVSTLTQMSSTLMLGWYQFSPPNYAFVSGDSVALHMYGAVNMAPTPIEIELTKTNNQAYVSTVNVLGAVNPVGVSTMTIPVGVSSIATPVTVSSGVVSVSTVTIPVGVSSIATPVATSSLATPVTVSSGVVSVSSATAAVTAAMADRLLGRNVSSGGDGGRTVSEAMFVLRNKVDAGAGVVYATDDSTTAWSFTVSTVASDPIQVITPV